MPPLPQPRRDAPTPASVHRPLSVGEVLDRAACLYRENFLTFFFIPFFALGLYYALYQALVLAFGPATYQIDPSATPDMLPQILADASNAGGVSLVSWVAGLIANVWSVAALVDVISRRHLGAPATWRQAFRDTRDRLPHLLVTTAVVQVLTITAFVLLGMWAGVTALFGPVFGVVSFPLALAVIGFAFFWVLTFWLHAPAIVVERRGIGEALLRSRDLMRHRQVFPGAGPWTRFWRGLLAQPNHVRLSLALIVRLLVELSVGVLASLPVLLGALVASLAEYVDLTDVATWQSLAYGPFMATQLAAQAIAQPFAVAVTVIFYYDRRYRAEGLDLELRVHALREAARVPVAVAGAA